MSGIYEKIYQRSIDDPDGFWADAARDLHWDREWDHVLDRSNPPSYRWFVGGQLNTCYNALDRHVLEGRAEQAALNMTALSLAPKRAIAFGSCAMRWPGLQEQWLRAEL